MRDLRPLLFIPMALSSLALGCGDPIRDAAIEALGDEVEGFEEGPTHRPGQPCLLCHDGYVVDDPLFSFGGTLFYEPEGQLPYMVEGFTVRLLDSEGQTFDMRSNKCGNFYVTRDQFDPAFPVSTQILAPSPDDPDTLLIDAEMFSRIGRDGSCGGCHIYPVDFGRPVSPLTPGVVTVRGANSPDPPPPPENGACPPPSFLPQLLAFD